MKNCVRGIKIEKEIKFFIQNKYIEIIKNLNIQKK